MEQDYASMAKTVSIQCSSRASVKIGQNFYTFEATEQRSIPDNPNVDVDKEQEILFAKLHAMVDRQIDETLECLGLEKQINL